MKSKEEDKKKTKKTDEDFKKMKKKEEAIDKNNKQAHVKISQSQSSKNRLGL